MVTLNSVTHGDGLRHGGIYLFAAAEFVVFMIVGTLFAFALIGFFQ